MAGDFALGLAVGIGSGMAIGIGTGKASSKTETKKKLEEAISDNVVSVVSPDGKELSAEQLFDLLEKN